MRNNEKLAIARNRLERADGIRAREMTGRARVVTCGGGAAPPKARRGADWMGIQELEEQFSSLGEDAHNVLICDQVREANLLCVRGEL